MTPLHDCFDAGSNETTVFYVLTRGIDSPLSVCDLSLQA